MTPLFFPASLLLGTLWALTRQDQPQGQAGQALKQGAVTHADRAKLLAPRENAFYFRPDARAHVLRGLSQVSLARVPHEGEGFLYRAIPLSQGAVTGAQIVAAAEQKHLCAYASLSAAVTNSGEVLVLIAHEKDKGLLAGPTSAFGVLTLPRTAAATPRPVSSGPMFDAHLPPNVGAQVAAALSDASIEALGSMSKILEGKGYPLAAKALADRIPALELAKELDAARAPAPVAPAPKERKTKTNGIAHVEPPAAPAEETTIVPE